MKVKLEDVCERGSSNLKQSDIVYDSGNYPIYGASGYIGNVDFYHQDKPYVAVVKDGAGIGRTTLHPAKSSVIGTMQYLIPKKNVLPEYLYYVVRYMHLEKYFTGATIPHIYFKDYKNEQFNLDSLEKQKEIIDILKKCESVINAREKELQKLDKLIRARFVEMFGSPSINNKMWQMGVINEIGSCTAGATPSTKVDEYWNNGTIPWMSSGEVNKGRVDRTDKLITHFGYDKTSTKLVPPKTVVLAMAGQGKTRGMAAITEIELCTNQSICSIVNNEKVDAEYLLYFLKLQYNELRRASTNTDGRGGLNLKIIGNYPIMIPPVDLQKRFATFVEQVNKSKLLATSQLQIHIYKTLTLL